jgi:hypothetical protein
MNGETVLQIIVIWLVVWIFWSGRRVPRVIGMVIYAVIRARYVAARDRSAARKIESMLEQMNESFEAALNLAENDWNNNGREDALTIINSQIEMIDVDPQGLDRDSLLAEVKEVYLSYLTMFIVNQDTEHNENRIMKKLNGESRQRVASLRQMRRAVLSMHRLTMQGIGFDVDTIDSRCRQ